VADARQLMTQIPSNTMQGSFLVAEWVLFRVGKLYVVVNGDETVLATTLPRVKIYDMRLVRNIVGLTIFLVCILLLLRHSANILLSKISKKIDSKITHNESKITSYVCTPTSISRNRSCVHRSQLQRQNMPQSAQAPTASWTCRLW